MDTGSKEIVLAASKYLIYSGIFTASVGKFPTGTMAKVLIMRRMLAA